MEIARRPLLLAGMTAVAAVALSWFAQPLLAKGAGKPAPAPKPTAPTKPPSEAKPKDILDTLAASTDPTFHSLLDAIKAADLTSTLKGNGPFTLFAPSDDAFKKLPEGKLAEWMKPENKAALKAVLNDHVVASKMLKADLTKAKTVKSAAGHALEVKLGDDKVWAGILDAKVTRADVTVSNGVIHFMDAVILAPAAGGAGPAYTTDDVAKLKDLVAATLTALDGGANAAALAKLGELDAGWKAQEAALKAKDAASWAVLQKSVEKASAALHASTPDVAGAKAALQELQTELAQSTKARLGHSK
jgi:uncharacterized surface protein with fasciclin (FAS1) repeats